MIQLTRTTHQKLSRLAVLAIWAVIGLQTVRGQTANQPTPESLLTFKEIDSRWATASLQEVMTAAEGGDAVAQCQLGARFAMAKGVATNLPVAVDWYHKAALQGLAHAQFRLGMMY